ncbi:methyltransferase family protein [Chloroflexota bacterium]
MSLADRWADTIYRFATTKSRLKIVITPIGIVFWFGFSTLLVFASLWLDGVLPVHLPFVIPVGIFVSLPLLILGSVLCLWTVFSFFRARGSPVPLNPPQKLVVKGLYAYVRNPMTLGWFLILFGVGVVLNSISLIFIFTPLFIYLNFVYLKTVEEKEMEKKFGKEYLTYKQSVPMFIPWLGKRK